MDDSVLEVKLEAVRAMAAVFVDGIGMENLDKKERERLGAGLIAKSCEVGFVVVVSLAWLTIGG